MITALYWEAAIKPGPLREMGLQIIYLALWGGTFGGNSLWLQCENVLGAASREEETEHYYSGGSLLS